MDYKFQDRLDRLAMLYVEKHYNIKELSPAEYLKVFNKTLEDLVIAMNDS